MNLQNVRDIQPGLRWMVREISAWMHNRKSHMPNASVFCLAASQSQADVIVMRLRTAGIANGAISVLLPDPQAPDQSAPCRTTMGSEGAATGAGAGGVVGGTLGLLAGIGAISLPGIGPLIAAGPIIAAISGAAVGAAVGGIAGGLIGLGMPEYDALEYESQVRGGNILISVHAESPAEVRGVKEIFWASGAQGIAAATADSSGARMAVEGLRNPRP